MDFTIVTFNTPEYKDCLDHFIEKSKEFGVAYKPYCIASTGDWHKNTRMKPMLLVKARKEIRGPILYFDIDSELLACPSVPNRLSWDVGIVENPRKEHKNRVSSQCLWLNDTAECLRFLYWWEYTTLTLKSNDHVALTKTLRVCEEMKRCVIISVEDSVRGCWKFNGLRPERSQATLV